jgi:hypothetical protein
MPVMFLFFVLGKKTLPAWKLDESVVMRSAAEADPPGCKRVRTCVRRKIVEKGEATNRLKVWLKNPVLFLLPSVHVPFSGNIEKPTATNNPLAHMKCHLRPQKDHTIMFFSHQ